MSTGPDETDETPKPASPATLTPRAIRHLRALAHPLKPVVQIGKEGITPAFVDAAKGALLTHELMKVKVLTEAPVERHAAGHELAAACEASLVQVVGRTLTLYKRHPKKPKIVLPRA